MGAWCCRWVVCEHDGVHAVRVRLSVALVAGMSEQRSGRGGRNEWRSFRGGLRVDGVRATRLTTLDQQMKGEEGLVKVVQYSAR